MSPRKWRYFTDAEVKGLSPDLVNMLDKARDLAGIPFVITSGYRTPAQNKKAGGVRDSAHEHGLAVDLRAPNEAIQKIIKKALKDAGFVRVGTYDKHLHVDIDRRKPQVAWAGGRSHA